MSLAGLVFEWRKRLARLRRGIAVPGPGEIWLSAIQIRVLQFLVTRYSPLALQQYPPPLPERMHPPPQPFCLIDDPTGPPPRSAAQIAALLADVRLCNRPARRRWRFSL